MGRPEPVGDTGAHTERKPDAMPETTPLPRATGVEPARLPAPRLPADDRPGPVAPVGVFDVLDEYPLVRYALEHESHHPVR